MSVEQNIRHYRAQQDLTQEEFAALVGVAQFVGHVSKAPGLALRDQQI